MLDIAKLHMKLCDAQGILETARNQEADETQKILFRACHNILREAADMLAVEDRQGPGSGRMAEEDE